jgi:hypothetical protein
VNAGRDVGHGLGLEVDERGGIGSLRVGGAVGVVDGVVGSVGVAVGVAGLVEAGELGVGDGLELESDGFGVGVGVGFGFGFERWPMPRDVA